MTCSVVGQACSEGTKLSPLLDDNAGQHPVPTSVGSLVMRVLVRRSEVYADMRGIARNTSAVRASSCASFARAKRETSS